MTSRISSSKWRSALSTPKNKLLLIIFSTYLHSFSSSGILNVEKNKRTLFFSRIIYFPFVVLHTTLVKSMWLYEPFFGYYFFNFLLAVLQLLHLYWFYLILEMAYNLLKGKEISDTRSEDEFSVDESDNDNLPDAKKTK